MTCPYCGEETPADGNCAACGALLEEEEDATGLRSALAQPDRPSSTAADDDSEGETGLVTASIRSLRDDEDESEAQTGYASSSGSSRPRSAPASRRDEGPLEVGQSFGRYHIIRLLGLGGMGAVYHAWDEELGVGVALKIVRPEIATDPQAARDLERRFKRELLLARQVTHKNVVRMRAYLDQLARGRALSAERARALTAALDRADEILGSESRKDPEAARRLDDLAAELEADSGRASGRDQARLRSLAETVKGITKSLR